CGDKILRSAPRHFLRSEQLYEHSSGVFFGPNAEWVPQAYYVDSTNTGKTEGYVDWGLKPGFDNGGPLSAYIEGRNLSNEAYIASVNVIDQFQGRGLSSRERPGGLRWHTLQGGERDRLMDKNDATRRRGRLMKALVQRMPLAIAALCL